MQSLKTRDETQLNQYWRLSHEEKYWKLGLKLSRLFVSETKLYSQYKLQLMD